MVIIKYKAHFFRTLSVKIKIYDIAHEENKIRNWNRKIDVKLNIKEAKF